MPFPTLSLTLNLAFPVSPQLPLDLEEKLVNLSLATLNLILSISSNRGRLTTKNSIPCWARFRPGLAEMNVAERHARRIAATSRTGRTRRTNSSPPSRSLSNRSEETFLPSSLPSFLPSDHSTINNSGRKERRKKGPARPQSQVNRALKRQPRVVSDPAALDSRGARPAAALFVYVLRVTIVRLRCEPRPCLMDWSRPRPERRREAVGRLLRDGPPARPPSFLSVCSAVVHVGPRSENEFPGGLLLD